MSEGRSSYSPSLWFDDLNLSGSGSSQGHKSSRTRSALEVSCSSPQVKPKVIRLKSRQSMGSDDLLSPTSQQESLIWSGPEDRVFLATHPEKLGQHNPYIGYFHRGHKANYQNLPNTIAGDLAQPQCKKRRRGLVKSVSTNSLCQDAASASIMTDYMDTHMELDGCEEVELEEQEHKNLMKKALQLREGVPESPELCGIQAMLPRQSGVRVLEKLGEGSFGKVVLANNQKNKSQWDKMNVTSRQLFDMPAEGQNLVLKCVRKDSSGVHGSISEGELVQREVRLHSRCTHPNIVKIYGFYEQEEVVTLILGFAEGRELHTILQQQRRFEEVEAVPMFLQILRAVDFMHGLQIVHRDLKPRNILVSASGKATVIDLGLAIDLADPKDKEESMSQEIVGTLGYLPPEMHQGRSIVGLPMDIWALGVILYEAVFGFSPFLPHEIALPQPVEFPDPSWGMHTSDALQDLLRQLLNKESTERISARSALHHYIWSPEIVTKVDNLVRKEGPQATISSTIQDANAMEDEDFNENFAIKVNKDIVGNLEWGGQYFYEYYLAVVADPEGSQGSDPEF